MKMPFFEEEDLRILADLAIDLFTDNLYFEVIKIIDKKENYWSIDCRFATSKDEIKTYYDSLHISCGRDNMPETYQMSWTIKNTSGFMVRPITSPLVVVAYFNEMCKKQKIKMN